MIQGELTDIRVKDIVAHTAPANPASCRVLEERGFRRVCGNEKSGYNRLKIIQNRPVPTAPASHAREALEEREVPR